MLGLSRGRGRFSAGGPDAEVDLVPLIDCVFLLLLFFMLVGRITLSERGDQVTVPPAKTGNSIPPPGDWQRVVISLAPADGEAPAVVQLADQRFAARSGADGWGGLRALLDRIHDHARAFRGADGIERRAVVVEVRADAEAGYRAVQELQQILSDGIDPTTMQPRTAMAGRRPLVDLEFTVRRPDGG
jgi:biopolymer transport protein ExbD